MAMTKIHFSQLQQTVIDRGLCARCGICAGVCPVQVIRFDEDRFPVLAGRCTACGFCSRCCPGAEVDFPALSRQLFAVPYDPADLQGYTENLFVSHPADNAARLAGASGGLVTGLLLYLLEKGEIEGALVVRMDPEKPYLSRGTLATTAAEIRDAAQSKYCLTPSMELLGEIRRRKGKFAVVALPCQIHGLRKLADVDPRLADKIAYIFGLYCNCNLNPNGHLEAIRACNISLDEVARFDFRGGGWPGGFFVRKKDGTEVHLHPSIIIKDVMNIMFRLFGAWRCYLCIDALAEYGDLSFGDFWAIDYAGSLGKLERCTLVSQRTGRGLRLLEQAVADGALVLHPLPRERASKRILNMARGKKSRGFVRLLRLAARGEPVPDYRCSLPKPPASAFRKERLYRMYFLFRGPRARRFVLRVLFSPVGVFLDKINVRRKKLFCKYHDN
ncbi:MAG: Coenzyme F420 hydrogenase/dehydrogenase, beta subunit C-terminal domain [Desulfobulbaceae bacterium]